MQTMLNIKIDTLLKEQAQAVANDLGVSLSAILKNTLKELVQERRVVFSDHPEPNNQTKKILNQALKEIHKKNSKSFQSEEEMDKYLLSL